MGALRPEVSDLRRGSASGAAEWTWGRGKHCCRRRRRRMSHGVLKARAQTMHLHASVHRHHHQPPTTNQHATSNTQQAVSSDHLHGQLRDELWHELRDELRHATAPVRSCDSARRSSPSRRCTCGQGATHRNSAQGQCTGAVSRTLGKTISPLPSLSRRPPKRREREEHQTGASATQRGGGGGAPGLPVLRGVDLLVDEVGLDVVDCNVRKPKPAQHLPVQIGQEDRKRFQERGPERGSQERIQRGAGFQHG